LTVVNKLIRECNTTAKIHNCYGCYYDHDDDNQHHHFFINLLPRYRIVCVTFVGNNLNNSHTCRVCNWWLVNNILHKTSGYVYDMFPYQI
jgi:hypothetical protein